jgi:two-component system phosphate regulon response regulator PhoB
MNNLTIHNLYINEEEKLCYINNKSIQLTKAEYDLLLVFLTHRNKVFTREELKLIIDKEKIKDRAIDAAISRLRKKIGEYSKYIVTRSGFGYSFIDKE